MGRLMGMKKLLAVLVSGVVLSSCGGSDPVVPPVAGPGVTMASVGKKLFFDENLSSRGNQSCASCHDPATGFADPRVSSSAPVSEGSEPNAFGDRNAPTAAYAFFSPVFNKSAHTTQDGTVSNYQGGQFLDGRRANLMAQAKDPFLNPVEMNNADAAEVVAKVSNSSYADDVKAVFGATVFDDVTTAYTKIAMAIAAFEASAEVNRFTSKFDAVMAGTESFTAAEQRGFDLFKGNKAKCANCHTVPDTGPVLFTNHRFYNIGTPANPDNPIYATNAGYVDVGLGGTTVIDTADAAAEKGKFRTPTLRNIEKTAPYMHNGVYQTLEDVIRHYDIQIANEFITPEVADNMANEMNAGTFVGLDLSPQDYADLIAFMKTLTDR